MSTSASGLDFAHIDSTVRIQDDLYRYFNGAWLKSAVIPADRATDGAFVTLRDLSEKQVRAIIESATGSEEAKKISDLYASFMAADAIEEKGFSPILSDLTKCDSIQNLNDFISTIYCFHMTGFPTLEETWTDEDKKFYKSKKKHVHRLKTSHYDTISAYLNRINF